MPPEVIAAGITAAGSALGAGASAVSSGKLNRKTMRFNREEAEKQRQWNEAMYEKQNAWNYEMWLKENEYNTPQSQVNRLRDAGLNPLYFGLDGSSAGDLSAAQPLGYDRAQISGLQNPFAGLASPLAAGLDSALKIAQISNVQADTAKKGEETTSEVVRREQMQQQTANLKQELNNMLAQENLTKSQRAQIEKGLEWADRLNAAAVGASDSSAKLSDSQRNRIDELLRGEKLMQVKTLEDFEHKWQAISAEIDKMAADTDLSVRQLEDYALDHAQSGFMGSGLSLPNIIRNAFETDRKFKKKTGKTVEEWTDSLDPPSSGASGSW